MRSEANAGDVAEAGFGLGQTVLFTQFSVVGIERFPRGLDPTVASVVAYVRLKLEPEDHLEDPTLGFTHEDDLWDVVDGVAAGGGVSSAAGPRMVLVTATESWCTPCHVVAKSMRQLARAYADHLAVVWVRLFYISDSHGEKGGGGCVVLLGVACPHL